MSDYKIPNDDDVSPDDIHAAADLWDADLSEAYLRDADLSEADLMFADLSEADLRDAADLSGAYLPDADLSGANLSKAYLSEAELKGANPPLVSILRAERERRPAGSPRDQKTAGDYLTPPSPE